MADNRHFVDMSPPGKGKQPRYRMDPRSNKIIDLPMCHLNPESKNREFGKYLEKAGVLDCLTRVLFGLYEEQHKPMRPMLYFLAQLDAGGSPLKIVYSQMKADCKEYRETAVALEKENAHLRALIAKRKASGSKSSKSKSWSGSNKSKST